MSDESVVVPDAFGDPSDHVVMIGDEAVPVYEHVRFVEWQTCENVPEPHEHIVIDDESICRG